MRRKRTVVLAATLASIAAIFGIWWYFKSREIKVWVYTDYAFRYSHREWPGVVEARFREVNRIYQRNGTGILWKVVDSSQVDPTANVSGLDNRRASLKLHVDHRADIYLILTGVHEVNRTASVSPFSHVALVVDYPDQTEAVNAGLLAHELAHLFGAPQDRGWLESLMAGKADSNKFPPRTVALIKRMRDYPFSQGIDALQGSWEKRAFSAAKDDPTPNTNPVAHAHTILGTALINERKIEQSLVHFRAAVAADPQNKTMHLNLAEAYSRDGLYDLALAEAREGVRLAPEDAFAHRALGALLGHNHQPEAALQEIQTAIRLDPTNAQNEVLLGIEYAGMFGHLDDAVSALQEAARADPDSAIAALSLQKAQALKQRVESMIVTEREQIQSHPDDPDAHYRLAKAEARAGDLQGAIRDFQKAAELRPDNGSAHTELAELYLVKGDAAAAWAEVRKARALGTEPPQSLIARMPPLK